MKIPRLKQGKAPSFLDTEFGNQIITLIENLYNMQIAPQGGGKLVAGGGNVVLDLSSLAATIQQLNMLQQTAQPPGGGGGGGPTSTAVTNKINQIISALDGMSATAVCNPSTGTITVSFVIDVPSPL